MVRQSELVEETRRQAHAKHDKSYASRKPPAEAQPALLPVSICVADGSGGIMTEQILWRLGDPAWEPKGVAGRICQDLNLPVSVETEIEQQIQFSLKGLTRHPWKDLGGEKRVALQVYVRIGNQVVKDELEWDLNNPVNSSEAYAARICQQLDLGLEWFDAINAYVKMRIAELVKDLETNAASDLETNAASVSLLPPVEEAVRQTPSAAAAGGRLPRLEEYTADGDWEAVRLKARARAQTAQ